MCQRCVRMQACLEAGFQDFATLRQDPDLAAVRGAELDQLLGRWDLGVGFGLGARSPAGACCCPVKCL